ncbi:MAG: type IX secretion system membrane protein PorP/SprF [Crocinitomicaceae bacterium]|nr:type IX secretion system membrane protein PorP/SprF [Crocinitomicaceae bacterium]MBK8927896.1 type IX secretion system membrane protein PorP/SprF [Crocinitomicaceae bacterium]
MKKIISIAVLSFSLAGFGQQTEHYTQYEYNQFAFNPAVAGTKSCIDIRSGYRFQWVGIDGAPETGFINAHAPLHFSKKNRMSFGPKHGIGGQIKRDKFGPFSFLMAEVTYALHIPINRNWTLSFGTSLGVKQATFNVSSLTTEVYDPAIPNSSPSYVVFPDGKAGLWLADKKTYIGLSIHNLYGRTMKNVGTDNDFQRHFYFTAGRSFRLKSNWTFIPSVFFLKTKNTPLDFHLSAVVDMENKLAFGIGLRRTDAITAQVRVKLFNFISVGYSFDFVISKLAKDMWYTHEITGGFNSCSNYGNSSTTDCPAFE